MPKLSSSTAEAVDNTEGSSFEALPEGIYRAVLDGEVTPGEGKRGPYWKWTFKIAEGEEGAGRKQFLNTSLSENSFWRLKQVFEAFGVSADTDTDDLIGRPVRLVLVQKPIGEGARKGEMGNEIREILPADADARPKTKANGAKAGAKEDVPLF